MSAEHTPLILGQLIANEEVLRQATADAERDMQEGKTTEAVFDVLRGEYFVAKQAREDFEKNS